MRDILEIEKEYKEWVVDLLKVRFDLKPEAFDEHHKNNYSFENCSDCLWNKIKRVFEQFDNLEKRCDDFRLTAETLQTYINNNEQIWSENERHTRDTLTKQIKEQYWVGYKEGYKLGYDYGKQDNSLQDDTHSPEQIFEEIETVKKGIKDIQKSIVMNDLLNIEINNLISGGKGSNCD